MPKLTDEQILEYINTGIISAITVDTAIFDKYNCDLTTMSLTKLEQFKKGGVKLLLSEVILKEVTKHIAIAASETQRAFRAALKKHANRWKPEIDLEILKADLKINDDAVLIAEQQVKSYLELVNAQVVPAHGTYNLAKQVLDYYFEVKAPFEEKKDKKNEFPDAFALLSLEEKAKEQETIILCISPDKGWSNFAESSNYLVVVSDLNLVLSWFNNHGRIIAEKVLTAWKADKALNLDNAVESAFEYYLDGHEFDIDGDAPLEYEAEPIGAILQHLDKNSIQEPIVIAEDDDSVTFMVKAKAKISFEAHFSFYAYDSHDRDNIGLGSETAETEKNLTFEITISVDRDIEDNEIEVIEVDITPQKISVDFGYVDPFPDDDPTFEKY